MRIPPEFELLCKSFFQGVTELYESTDEMVAEAISDLTTEQRLIVCGFLDELTSGKYSEEQIESIW